MDRSLAAAGRWRPWWAVAHSYDTTIIRYEYWKQAIAPRSGPLQFDFVKDWTTRCAGCAINSSTGLIGHGLRPAPDAAS